MAALGALCILAGGLVMACSGETKPAGRVHVLTWDGIVNPVMERYVDRGIDTAERSQAQAVVLRLDTPGGLDSSMRKVIQRIIAARVPVLVYVSPSGGRAASAGTFITMAGHVAAMAPSTTIGAATPIQAGGGDIGGDLGRKVKNDAVAYARTIAEQRGRNADWAEQAVREAAAVTETEAVTLDVVDFVASSLEDLLRQASGRQVQVATEGGGVQTVTLRTAGAPLVTNGPNLFEQLLYRIADPDVAFLLLTIGSLALISEVFHPTFFAGVLGVIALILAWFALGSLPTNWAGVALIAFGFILLLAEVFVSGFGVLGIGGIVALILGGLILFSGADAPGFHVSRWLLFSLAAAVGAFFLLFVGTLIRLRRLPARAGRESLIGARGRALTSLDPQGTVHVRGERWEATAEDAPIEEGTPVIVTAAEGLRLLVKRDPASVRLLAPVAPEGPPAAKEG